MEKRRFQRIQFSERLSFTCSKGEQSGELLNLSLGGAYIANPTGVPNPGEILDLVLRLEGVECLPLSFKGEVLRVDENKGFAVKFLEIDQKSLNHLRNIIYYNSPNPEVAKKELYLFLGEAHPMFQTLKLMMVNSLKRSLMEYLLRMAFIYNPEKPFTLSSGQKSSYYLDCRRVTLHSLTFQLVGDLFWEEIRFAFVDGVAGMSIGADPIVCAVLASAARENVPLEGLLIRKEPKKYGTQRQIEGNIFPKMRVILVEDVVTTGGSVLKALAALREAGVKVIKVLALVDRMEGGQEAIQREGIPFKSFFTIEEILTTFKAQSPS